MADGKDGYLAGEHQKETSEKDGKVTYKIRLKVLSRETGQWRYATLEEARDWDWEDPDVWRMIGGWQVKSFQQLLKLLYMKMQKGITEVELLEAPRFAVLAG
jgi:hypothetical protein